MTEALVYVIGGVIALLIAVRFIIDAQMKFAHRTQEQSQQLNTTNDLSLRLTSLESKSDITLRSIQDNIERLQQTLDSRSLTQILVAQVRDEMREFRAQAANQQTLENVGKYLEEMRQELTVLQEMSTLNKINTVRIASIERHIIALHTMVVSDTPNQNMMQFPFPIPGMPSLPSGMGPGGMWKPLGIKREDGKYKTEDGEHEADSLEELLAKLASDPQYRIDPNFKRINPNDVEDMRRMFEGELEEDDDKEDWQKEKGDE